MANDRPARILVADDQSDVREALRLLLNGAGFQVVQASSPAAVQVTLENEPLDLALLDMNYARDTTSGGEGLELIAHVRARDPNLPIVVMTAWGSVSGAVEAMKRGASDYVEKPWQNDRLLSILRVQLELRGRSEQVQRYQAQTQREQQRGLPHLIAASAAGAPIRRLMERVAGSDAGVLITGEHGTGKDVVARWIHAASGRTQKSFVPVNAGALADGVFESELFGHVKGAFTDAKTDRVGCFELANGGALFFDEIGTMPASQQAKLLRVLQSGEYQAVGSSRTRHADVRVLSATNLDIDRELQTGPFRVDLLYTLEDGPLPQGFERFHSRGDERPARTSLARRCTGARACGGTRRGASGGGTDRSARSEPAAPRSRSARVGANDARRRRGVLDSQGGTAQRGECCRCSGRPRPVAQCALPALAGVGHQGSRMTQSSAPRPPPKGDSAWVLRATEHWHFYRVALPPALTSLWVIASRPNVVAAYTVRVVALAVSAWLSQRVGAALALRLHAISSVLTGYREGEFAIRVPTASRKSPLGQVHSELNALGSQLREHRLGEIEAWALLRKVMEEVRVMVLAFDAHRRVKLANAEAARVLRKPVDSLLLEPAGGLGLAELLEGPAARTIKDSRVLGNGRWELRRFFRWPAACKFLLTQPTLPSDWREDLGAGLSLVARRMEGLQRFIGEYARLAQLPPPRLQLMSVADWASRVSALEHRLVVQVVPEPLISVLADADQLDQLLINLLKNAVDASLERNGGVRVHWAIVGDELELNVDDDGLGVADTANLFVPFFTTKIGGSGIGLALARQIAEGHGGSVQVSNRSAAWGARAVVKLPLPR